MGPPAPPTGLTLTLDTNEERLNQFKMNWDTPHANQFIENGTRVDFPDPSFNIKSIVISHEPNGLQHRDNPLRDPSTLHARFGGIEHIKGTPGVTYTITTKLRNSEGDSTPVSAEITPLGPPAIPEAPTVSPESETSISVVWEEPDNNGGRPITGYEVQYQKDDTTNTWTEWTHTGTGTSTIITDLEETSTYNVQVKAKNNLGASDWSPTGKGRTAGLVVQITSSGNITSGNDAVFTVTLSKAATVTVNFTHAWTGGYGDLASGTLPFTQEGEISKNYTLPTARGNPGADSGSVTVTIDTDDAYEIGTSSSATVNIEKVNEPPEFPSETDDRSVTENTAASQNIGAPFLATDPDADETLTYTLDGTDAASFGIIESTGQLQTKATLDHETKDSYTVMVTATDSSDASDTIRVTITVTDENEPPAFAEETVTRTIPENTAEGQNIGTPVSATDPDTGETLTYTLSGDDAASFSIIESTGQLQTKANLDFENKASYTVTVTATDKEDLSDSIEVTITVTDVDEGPEVSGAPTRDYAENGTDPVATYTATNPENRQIAWSLLGDDSENFSINSGVLAFNAPPDYEAPADADTNNVYLVTVRASDGNNADTLAVTVTITDKNEPPAFTEETATRTIAENTAAGQNIGPPFLATDPDTGDTLTYSLGGTDSESFGIIATSGQLQTKAHLDFETKPSYTVTVTATDRGGLSDITTVNITVTDENETPSVSGQTSISYEENRTDTVATYTAADPENGAITWSLSGDDSGDFSISNAGLLTFSSSSSPPDYEAPTDADRDNIYLVNVLASDGANTASLDVTITVTDENETLVVAGNSPIDYSENSTGPVATYTADPEGTSITWDLLDEDNSLFSISALGVLTFKTSPDYETPGDANTNNVYLVGVRASDGPKTGTLDVTITVTDENEPPAFAAETAARTIEENTEADQNVGTPVSATDQDAGETLIYTLGGTDAASFGIIPRSGQLQTKATLDHETKPSYTVTLTATDSSDAYDTITVTITVTDENETPEFPSTETGDRQVAENTPASRDIGAAVAAIDPDTGDTLTYTLEGADLDSFDIDSASGQIQTKSGVTYDHEIKSSYSVTVKADDNNGGTATIDVTITVADVNEPPKFSVETASSTIAENTTTGVAIGAPVTATDPDTGDTPTYTLGSTDATFFDIDASTGQLQTKAALDYETKSGYTVTVTASDGTLTATLDVTVTITNIDEAGTVTLSTDRPPARAEITAALTDPDEGISGTVWQWERSSDGNTAWAGIGASSPAYTPVDGDVGYHLRATASYTDGHGPGKTAQAASTQAVQAGANRPPEFDSATATREVPENTAAGQNIGAPFLATDPDNDTLTYSLGGTNAASFGILATSGQLQTKAELDFEIKSTYTVTVTATDQGSLSDITTVTITVTDENETPSVSGQISISYEENGTDAVATYTASDPEGTSITWDLLGDDNSLFSISALGMLTFKIAPDFEAPADANTDNEYLVTVQASDGSNTDTQPVTVTVTNVNEPPTFAKETDARTISENTEAGQNIGAPFLATDPDAGETLTYALDGTDAASFDIDLLTSQLQTKADLDFEEKTSYTVMVTATDQDGLSDTTAVNITVTNVDEPPTVTGDSNINYAENRAGTVAAYTVVDPEGGQINWSLSGDDSGDFLISTSGVLTFNTPPDYETPASADHNNEYLVTVQASDGANTASLDVTITVTDENETSVVAGNSLIDYPENGTGPVATYTAADPEDSQITWSLSGDDSRHFSISSAGVLTFNIPPDYETPADASTNNMYLVEVRASDGPNTDTQAVAVTVTNVNEPPAFAAETAGRTIAENSEAGVDIGIRVSATDPDAGETLTYTLGRDRCSLLRHHHHIRPVADQKPT